METHNIDGNDIHNLFNGNASGTENKVATELMSFGKGISHNEINVIILQH